MNTRKTICRLVLGLACLAGCDDSGPEGPPELRLGRDECVECGMAIEDDRFVAALMLDRGGAREPKRFDDIGCLLDFEAVTDGVVSARYFKDASGRNWIDSVPVFVLADAERLRTPMASGIAAYSNAASAGQARVASGGELLDLEQLKSAREAWKARRRVSATAPVRATTEPVR